MYSTHSFKGGKSQAAHFRGQLRQEEQLSTPSTCMSRASSTSVHCRFEWISLHVTSLPRRGCAQLSLSIRTQLCKHDRRTGDVCTDSLVMCRVELVCTV